MSHFLKSLLKKSTLVSLPVKSLCLFIVFCFCCSAGAKIYINIGAPEKTTKSLIAISGFVLQSQNPDFVKLGRDMDKRLNKNLRLSAYFNILSPKAYIENPAERVDSPYPQSPKGFRWNNWKLTGADFLLFTYYSVAEGGQVFINVSFHNVNLKKTLFRKTYQSSIKQTAQVVDKISNHVIKSLSGKKGIFETKILAVRGVGGSKKELFVMDWDGQNKKRITYHRSVVLSPAWSNKGDQALYSAFVYNKRLKTRVATLFLYNFIENKIKILSAKQGANLGSAFFPNGKQILLSLSSPSGGLGIFKFNLKSLNLNPFINWHGRTISVEPSIHPKTKNVVFSSDKSGKTMIYTANPKGKNIRQITFAGHHNSSPDWHPEKNKIVFSGLSKGRMDLFEISSQGTGLKRLTSIKKSNGQWSNCESPSFSPDGRFVVFSSNISGTYQLYLLSLDDLSVERITFDRYNYKSPKWSPYL